MSDRTVARWTVDVNRSPTEVFAYLADVSKHGEWSPKPYRCEGVQPGPVEQGAAFTSYGWIPGDKEHRNDVRATVVDAPNKLVFEASDPGGGVFVNTFTVTPTDRGAKVDREMDMPTPGGFVGVMFPVIMRMVVRPGVQKGMNMMKAKVESG